MVSPLFSNQIPSFNFGTIDKKTMEATKMEEDILNDPLNKQAGTRFIQNISGK